MKTRILLTILISLLLNLSTKAQNKNISNGFIFDGEPYLAINPSNPQHMVVAWMNIFNLRTKVTFNGGNTWSAAVSIPHAKPQYTSADPSIDFDNAGNVYLCYVDYSVALDSGSVFVRKSITGGLSWGAAVEVINAHSDPGKYPCDRPWMLIDKSGGVNNGNIYVTTMNPKVFGPLTPPYHPYFMRSSNGGASFSSWRYLDTTGWLAGSLIPQPAPFPTISSNGTFHCVYPSWVLSQNLSPQYIFAKSKNAGTSFTYSSLTFASNLIFNNDTAKLGYPLFSNPADTNHLVFFNLLQPHGDADVIMWESFDGGQTWPSSTRVNDDAIANNRMQDMVWADFDADGDLVVSWRDRRNGNDSTFATSFEVWAAVKHRDSTNFYPNFKISDTIVAYDTVLSYSGNDFMCVKIMNDTISAVWGDTRSGKLNIWFQRMSINGTILSTSQLASENILDIKIYPNPSNSIINVQAANIEKITLYSSDGKIVMAKENKNSENSLEIDISTLKKGIYFIDVLTAEGSIAEKIIKE